MRDLLFYAICACSIFGVSWGLIDTRRLIQAPFLYAIGMLIIVCPQYAHIMLNPERVNDDAYEQFSMMVILCSIAMSLGYMGGPRSSGGDNHIKWEFDDRRLFIVGLVTASIGTFGWIQLPSADVQIEWRGWPVYWVTLAKFILPGATIMLVSFARTRRPVELVAAALFFTPVLLAIFSSGRRSATLVLPIACLAPFMLQYRTIRVPRVVIIAGIVGAFIVVYAFPYWRGHFSSGGYSQAIAEQPLSDIVEELLSSGSEKVLEILDGMSVTGAHYRTDFYGYGFATAYDNIIELYVPGTLVGREFKNSLFMGGWETTDWIAQANLGKGVSTYTSKSGFADLYGEFWLFGSIFVFLIAKLFKRVYTAAVHTGDARAILFLAMFTPFPGTIPYAAVIGGIAMQVPQLVLFFIAMKYCVHRTASVSVGHSTGEADRNILEERNAIRLRAARRGAFR
jgi:hypothetical protein